MATMMTPELERLAQLKEVWVKKTYSECCKWPTLASTLEVTNDYVVKEQEGGQDIMKVQEKTDIFTRGFWRDLRSFDFYLIDDKGRLAIHLHRPIRCTQCCFPCFLQTMEVSSPPGTLLGRIEQEMTLCTPFAGKFTIRNVSGDELLKIEAPFCACALCGNDVFFKVLRGGQEVTRIKRKGLGMCCVHCCSDYTAYSIHFPLDMDVRTKALLLGAAFLIDYVYYVAKSETLLVKTIRAITLCRKSC